MPFLRGARPSPRHRLAAARPHVATTVTPARWLWLPTQLSMWLNDVDGDCCTAEEAFAKATHSPEIFITDATVREWASKNGVLNGADLTQVLDLMQRGGFAQGGSTYDDGPFTSVDWTNSAVLQNAISIGPVKIGVAADQLQNTVPNPPVNGWYANNFKHDANEDHCVSLCGYGPIGWLAWRLGAPFPAGAWGKEMAYALFTWDSIGIITPRSMIAITSEAWLRRPTTVIA